MIENLTQAVGVVLAGTVFPAHRWQLVAQAEYYGADAATRARVHQLPERLYPDLSAVISIITADADRPRGRGRGQAGEPPA